MEAISSQQLTGKCNRTHIITANREKRFLQKYIQETRSILNQIIKIQSKGNGLVSLPTKSSIPHHIGNVVKIILI